MYSFEGFYRERVVGQVFMVVSGALVLFTKASRQARLKLSLRTKRVITGSGGRPGKRDQFNHSLVGLAEASLKGGC